MAALVHRPPAATRAIPKSWKPFNYTYHFFWGLEDVIAVYTNMWSQLDTDKSVGGLFPNDGDGNAWGDKHVGFPPVLDKLGYTLTDPGRYQNLTDNFTVADLGLQAGQVRHHHRRDDPARLHHLLEPGAAAGLQAEGRLDRQGDPVPGGGGGARQRSGNNLSSEVWWTPNHPFKSSLTGQIGQAARRRLTRRRTRQQWTQPIGFVHALFEVAVDVLKRTARRGDAKATVPPFRPPSSTPSSATRLERRRAAALRGEEHRQDAAGRRPMAAAKGDGNKYDIVIVDNKTAPAIPAGRQDGADRLTTPDNGRRAPRLPPWH